MGQQHSHSHDGKPCHGHGPQQQHGHSHGAPQQHGHSHGGKPCHGHGPQAQQQQQHGHSHGAPQQHGHSHGAQQQHGHSHGGKPCHGHGPQAQQQGHSHGKQQHGHSHGGKPCHGHGPQAQHNQPQTPEEVELMKKQKACQLFMQTMVLPKAPIIFAHFHQNPSRDASKATTSGQLTVPFVEGEVMNRKEFHAFIEAFVQSQAHADGFNTVRFIELLQTEMQVLSQLGFKDAMNDPEKEIQLPYEMFKNLILNFIMRITLTRYDAIPFLFAQIGLGAMKLPQLPQLAAEKAAADIRKYSREKIMPLLIDFIETNAEVNKDHENGAVSSGFIATTNSIENGVGAFFADIRATQLPADKQDDEDLWRDYIMKHTEALAYPLEIQHEIANLSEQALEHPNEVLGEMKVVPNDENFDAELLAANVQQLVIIPLLSQNPRCLQYIAKEWSIELIIENSEGIKLLPPESQE